MSCAPEKAPATASEALCASATAAPCVLVLVLHICQCCLLTIMPLLNSDTF